MAATSKKAVKSGNSNYEKKVAVKGTFHDAMKFFAEQANKKVAERQEKANSKK